MFAGQPVMTGGVTSLTSPVSMADTAAFPPQSVAVTVTWTVAGQPVSAETATLPVIVTVFASVWVLVMVGTPSAALPVVSTTATPTSPAWIPQLSVTAPLKVTRAVHAPPTSAPTTLIAATGAVLSIVIGARSCRPG